LMASNFDTDHPALADKVAPSWLREKGQQTKMPGVSVIRDNRIITCVSGLGGVSGSARMCADNGISRLHKSEGRD
jgi:hypothetical protein